MSVVEAWRRHASDLADWVLERMVNRTDAYGTYQRSGGGVTAKNTLGAHFLQRHFCGEITVGLHTTSKENTCRWLALDFDCHTDDEALAIANLHAVQALRNQLQDTFDMTPIITDSNGRGGYHVVILLTEPLPTQAVCRFGKFLRNEFALGCEVYPKQEQLPPGGFGNWLRLPGKHHTHEAHWTKVWTGGGWLEGDAACQYLLACEGNDGAAVVLDERNHYGSAPARLEGAVGTDGTIVLSAFTLTYRLNGAEVGKRNDTLYAAACDYNGCGMPKALAAKELVPIALRTGLTDAEAMTAIESAYSSPKDPRGLTSAIDVYNAKHSPAASEDDGNPAGAGESVATPPQTPTPDGDTGESEDAGRAATTPRPTLANFIRVTTTGGETQRVVRSVESIAADINRFTRGWPRRAGGMMFAMSSYDTSRTPPADAVRYLKSPEELFAWVNLTADVSWVRQGTVKGMDNLARTPITKGELTAHVRDTCLPNYTSIEFLPHTPHVPGLFYVPFNLPEPTGDALTTLMDHTNPDTEDDRALLLASLVTPGWGGPPGARPAFVLSSDHGRGVGKTATVTAFTQLWGGAITLTGTSKQDWQQAKSRLLDEAALSQRCVVIDNFKGKLSVSELEEILTSPRIDGKRMYVGQASRPQRLTFYMTANVPRMSRDLAERSIIIKIGDAKWNENFVEWAQQFIHENHLHLLADIYAWLQQPPKCDLTQGGTKLTRWNSWAYAVLSRFENGADLLQIISDRRESVDGDAEEAEEIRMCIRDAIQSRGLYPDTGLTLINRVDMLELLKIAKLLEGGGAWSLKRVFGYLKSLTGSGMLQELANVSDGSRRYWLWSGPDAAPGATRTVMPAVAEAGVPTSYSGPQMPLPDPSVGDPGDSGDVPF